MSMKVVLTVYLQVAGIAADTARKALEHTGAEVVNIPAKTEDELIEAARDADAIIVAIENYSRRVIENLDRCKVIATIGIGYDFIDVAAATEHGIIIVNNWDYCIEEVSDHAASLLLASARKILPLDKAVKAGRWDAPGRPKMHDEILPPVFRVRGQTLGLAGFGNTGYLLATKLQGFGLKIIAHDPYVSHEVAAKANVQLVDFETLVKESDYISIHAALTDETRHMFGIEQFKKMKPTAYLINTARGGLIDEQALYTALSQGLLAGAALDPMDPEPVAPDNPLLKLDNVILTSHMAYYSQESDHEVFLKPPQKIARVLSGEWPERLVNPQVKENFIKRWGKEAIKG